MAVDVYAPCPCGSGKKFKFCCVEVADEMEKVTRLAENNQPHVALQMLERLHKEHPNAPWISTAHATILFQERRYVEARDVLQPLVERQPEHAFAVGLHATAAVAAGGWPAAKPAVYRAFQKAGAGDPGLLSGLALTLATLMFADEKYLGSRQYLALAMRLAEEEDQQDIFLRLLQFDGDGQILFPLRSVHQLADYTASAEEQQKEVRKAHRLVELGCFEPAARVFAKLAEQDPERAELWQNVGLCRAWDGDEVRAAETLHQAARLHADFEQGVECETLAQLLDLNRPDEHVPVVTDRYAAKSVGRLLSRLDENIRFARVHLPPPQEDEDEPQPAGLFELLDRPKATWPAEHPLGPDDVPVVIAQFAMYDEDREEGHSARALLTGFEDEQFQAARELLREAAGDDLEPEPAPAEAEPVVESIPREWHRLQWRWRFPEGMPAVERRRIEREQWQRTVADVWPNLPLSGLGGRTPREASSEESLRLRLRAATHVFDAYCDRARYQLDLDAVCRELKIAGPQPIEVRPDLPLNTLSSMQLIRLPVGQLSDGQLLSTLNRALLIHHGRFLYQVLTEGLSRPACVETMDLRRAYMTLVDLCRNQFRRDEALQWIARGREHAKSDEKPFEAGLHWALGELMIRFEDPNDPELPPLLQHTLQYYGPKLPQLREYLEQMVAAHRVPVSLEDLSAAPAGATTPGALWTPAGPESTPEGGRKLWVPGQD